MLDVNTAVEKFSTLIQSRASYRTASINSLPVDGASPLRVLGEMMLNKFSSQLFAESMIAEQKSEIQEEILENVVSSFALAGLLGIDLNKELNDLIVILESVSAEAS